MIFVQIVIAGSVDNWCGIPYNIDMSNTIYAVILEPNLPAQGGRRASCFRPGGDQESECPCGKKVSFEATAADADRVVVVFCGKVCYNEHHGEYLHVPELKLSPRADKKSDKPKFCEECNGKSKPGPGYDHASTCSHAKKRADAAAKKREARGNCPECDGPPGKFRGWKHNEGCSKVAPKHEPKPPCTECGGPRRGKGYTHVDGCSLKPKPQAKAAKGPRPKGRRRRAMPAGIA